MTEPLTVATDSTWRSATVRSVDRPTPSFAVLRLDVPGWSGHAPGQHCVVRLTAEDGYTASRSYSLASSPTDSLLELAIERLVDGEVSGYLTEVAEAGDEFEVRGPIGGFFVWDATSPAVCIGGGTGVVPFVSMLRYADHVGRRDLLTLAVSAKTLEDLPYAEELATAASVIAITRDAPATTPAAVAVPVTPRISRPTGRLTAADLAPLVRPGATYFVCGSAVFAEAATQLLLAVGVEARAIKVERFGPSGT